MRLCQGLSLCRNRLGIDKANLATWRLSLHPYLRQVTLFSRSQFSSSSLTQSQPEFGIKRPRKAPPLSTYEYRPLPGPKSTRIAILEPAEGFNEPVRLTLKRVSLQNLGRVRYEALSYVWGPVSGDRRVYCDGKIIHITPNCESALRHLRLKKKKRTLWIDALCINQSSNKERSRQVPLMGDIYESASRVLIWLGPDHGSLADAEGIIHISCNEWFSRMWTIQEHLLAKQSVLVAGYHYCSWTAFSSYWMWSLRAIHSLRKDSLPASLRIATWVAFKNTAAAKRGQSISSASFDIFSGFVECARTHRARDPRDKVYAFLPLIQKLQPSVAPLPVNYSLSYSRVYQDFARYTIRLSGTLKYLESLPPLRHKSSLPS
ncbi:hypothetical protein AUP68_18038 [Ilyonectria robusta]